MTTITLLLVMMTVVVVVVVFISSGVDVRVWKLGFVRDPHRGIQGDFYFK